MCRQEGSQGGGEDPDGRPEGSCQHDQQAGTVSSTDHGGSGYHPTASVWTEEVYTANIFLNQQALDNDIFQGEQPSSPDIVPTIPNDLLVSHNNTTAVKTQTRERAERRVTPPT